MSLADKTLHVCNCNGTMPLDEAALRAALAQGALPIRRELCQKEIAAFSGNAAGDVIVACTQEARLFGDVAEGGGKATSIKFVNVREHAAWSAEGSVATPKIAALLALAGLPEPEPVPAVSYESTGRLAIMGPGALALEWAETLKTDLAVCVIAQDLDHAELPTKREYPVYSGAVEAIDGWLGAFTVRWRQQNPIDLDLCVRCNACIKACPEDAIDFNYQVDLKRCAAHRACVAACGSIGAIDFAREDVARSDTFDLVLDLSARPLIDLHQPPQGYFAPRENALARQRAAAELVRLVGSFDKPTFFNYRANICAHSRSRLPGCNLCLDVCSAHAIEPAGDLIKIEPHLCVGCGACTTVCPSGALSFAYPPVPYLGTRIKTLLSTFGAAGGKDACILLHGEEGLDLLADMARRGRGLPARMLPLQVHHIASIGLDVWLAALAYGANQIAVLASGREAPAYVEALAAQMAIAETIVQALGYQDAHFRVIAAGDTRDAEEALWAWRPALGVRSPAAFNLTADKRTTAAMAIEHLLAHAPTPREQIALPAGAPFGTIDVDPDRCTLCLACTGACPEGAINDNRDAPQLRFIEAKCVQCGLCAVTCPEDAITLRPRLSLTREAKEPRVLHQAAIFSCIRCGKPLGTEKMIGGMLAKLAGHSMFAAPGALERLKMCADCRVIDMMGKELQLPVGGSPTVAE